MNVSRLMVGAAIVLMGMGYGEWVGASSPVAMDTPSGAVQSTPLKYTKRVARAVQQKHMQKSGMGHAVKRGPGVIDTAGTAESSVVAPGESEPTVSTSQAWGLIQKRIKNTVVQVVVHVGMIDITRPYRSPSEGVSYGSGFFISERGDIVTNAHVIAHAKSVWIQVPGLGQRILDVEIVGMSPDRDLALLRLRPESLQLMQKELGSVPFLPLGDSDQVLRSDEVLALGYPLGQQSLKSTNGIISGRERGMIQMSAPINPGSSGGPLLNTKGYVVGINSAGVVEAQNVGYAIPVNDLIIVLPDLEKVRIVRKPFLGVLFNNASDELTEYLGNPLPGGCYIVEVIEGSPLAKSGVQRGDMVYSINGYTIDIFGDMAVPWYEDKISIIEYVSRLSIGQEVNLVVYRKGKRKELILTFGYAELPPIHEVYPGYDSIDYEIFAGMVIMPLTLNHIQLMGQQVPGLASFAQMRHGIEPVLVITHIYKSSLLYRSRVMNVGCTLREVNGIPVKTLEDVRKAFKQGIHNKFLLMTAADNVNCTTDDGICVALDMKAVLKEELQLARDYQYPITAHTYELLKLASGK